MKAILRHALPGIVLALLTIFMWSAPILFLVLVIATTPPLVRRARRAREAAELDAARRLYFGNWHAKIDPIWLPQDVKQWLTTRPRLLARQRPGGGSEPRIGPKQRQLSLPNGAQ